MTLTIDVSSSELHSIVDAASAVGLSVTRYVLGCIYLCQEGEFSFARFSEQSCRLASVGDPHSFDRSFLHPGCDCDCEAGSVYPFDPRKDF